MANLGDNVDLGLGADVEVLSGAYGNAGQGNAGHARLTWTSAMSGFILCHFADLVGEGLKSDKGFKEVHLNAVARNLSEFANVKVTGTRCTTILGNGGLDGLRSAS